MSLRAIEAATEIARPLDAGHAAMGAARASSHASADADDTKEAAHTKKDIEKKTAKK